MAIVTECYRLQDGESLIVKTKLDFTISDCLLLVVPINLLYLELAGIGSSKWLCMLPKSQRSRVHRKTYSF